MQATKTRKSKAQEIATSVETSSVISNNNHIDATEPLHETSVQSNSADAQTIQQSEVNKKEEIKSTTEKNVKSEYNISNIKKLMSETTLFSHIKELLQKDTKENPTDEQSHPITSDELDVAFGNKQTSTSIQSAFLGNELTSEVSTAVLTEEPSLPELLFTDSATQCRDKLEKFVRDIYKYEDDKKNKVYFY